MKPIRKVCKVSIKEGTSKLIIRVAVASVPFRREYIPDCAITFAPTVFIKHPLGPDAAVTDGAERVRGVVPTPTLPPDDSRPAPVLVMSGDVWWRLVTGGDVWWRLVTAGDGWWWWCCCRLVATEDGWWLADVDDDWWQTTMAAGELW